VWSRQWGSPCAGGTAWLDPSPTVPLQGGVSDELSLSAYVTAAMLELGLSPTVRMTPSSPEGLVGWGRVLGQGVWLCQATSSPDLGATGLTGQNWGV